MKHEIYNIKNQIRSGFTLIETIIYLAIVSTILVSISYLILDILGGQTKSITTNEVNHNLRFISHILSQDISAAQDISSLTADTLILDMASDDITYNFDAINLILTRQVGAGAVETVNTRQVEISGSFNNRSMAGRTRNVGVALIVEYKNPNNLQDYVAVSSANFSYELRGRR